MTRNVYLLIITLVNISLLAIFVLLIFNENYLRLILFCLFVLLVVFKVNFKNKYNLRK